MERLSIWRCRYLLPLFGFAAALAMVSCDDRDTLQPATGQPPDLRFGILPLVIGNRWVYQDSLITSSSTRAITYAVSVLSVRCEGDKYWWTLQNRFNPSIDAREFMASNDSVFSLQHTDSPGGLAPVVSLEYIHPSEADTISYRSVFFGDAGVTKTVTLLHQEYSGPAGRFTGCLLYTYDINPEHYREILAPDVGVLSCEIQCDSTFMGPAWRRSITLAAYELAH